LHQLDTFYNALNANDQDSLNSAAGGNFLDKMPRECLAQILKDLEDLLHLIRSFVTGLLITTSNGYLRKGRKTKPKRQNQTRNGKAWKRQSQDKAQV
ncbi:hypothetical protein Tco_0823376, partial [Tanacetum coccineum]